MRCVGSRSHPQNCIKDEASVFFFVVRRGPDAAISSSLPSYSGIIHSVIHSSVVVVAATATVFHQERSNLTCTNQ